MLRSNAFARLIVCAAIALGVVRLAPAATTFNPLSGLLTARAGDNVTQFKPIAYGTTSLSDQDFVPSVNFASASLTANLTGTWRFDFRGSASSTTNVPAPPGTTNATALVSMTQAFTTTAPQWIQATARVTAPDDPSVNVNLTFGRSGQPALFAPGDTAGLEKTYNALLPAGTYSVAFIIDTQAVVAGAHAGSVGGNVAGQDTFASVIVAALADYNGNQTVDASDFAAVKNGFGQPLSGTGKDVDGNGLADGADILMVQRQLGTHSASPVAGAIPEPSAFALAACGLAILYCRTCRSAATRAPSSPAR